ncbi:MAG: DUF1631 domain-containing protein [Gammaproteobacteria bacterium]|nr:DUF1631 domain-containing protein [Gammaproteobacteria bacterium]
MLGQIQKKSINELKVILTEILKKVDDELFDHGNMAKTNKDQCFFFESMRILRIQRKNVETEFAQLMTNKFGILQGKSNTTQADNTIKFSAEKMSLLTDHENEENLAVNKIVILANIEHEIVLSQLDSRFDSLTDINLFESTKNPINPKNICEAFEQSIKSLNFDIKPKLVFYKTIEHFVIERLKIFYDEINHLMVKQNILPDLPGTPKIKNLRQKENKTDRQLSNEGSDVLSTLSEVLNNEGSTDSTSVLSEDVNLHSAINTAVIIQALSIIQQNNQNAQIAGTTSGNALDVREPLGEILPDSDSTLNQSIGKANENIVNIIEMLFDYILSDRNLPNEFKPIIGSLQIPLLKVAIIDVTFFSEGDHPARILLNEMAHSCIGWTSKTDNGFKRKFSEIINNINENFEDDIVIFSEALDAFQQLNKVKKEKVLLKIKRTNELEEAKARIELASTKAENAIARIIGQLTLPEFVNRLLLEDWKNLMKILYLRDGDKNETWDKYFQVGADLVASLIPAVTTKAQNQLRNSLPEIINNIKSGLDFIGTECFDNDQLFIELEQLHKKVLKGESVLIISEPNMEDVLENENQKDQLIIADVLPTVVEQSKSTAAEETVVTSSQSKQASKNDTKDDNSEYTQQLEPSFNMELNSIAVEAESSIDDEVYLFDIEDLHIGTWFEILQPELDRVVHCKLVAIIDSIGKYIFVNNLGAKVADYTLEQLEIALKTKQLIQLEQGVIFERALKSIVTNFRIEKSKAESH